MARSRRIMVGYDGSAAGRRALAAAADLVGYGSTLAVVTV
jgi:nucleotide-binding universal stress UspA family protein